MDLSVILISNRPKELTRAVDLFQKQCFDGISVELVIIQCINESNRAGFSMIDYPSRAKVKQMLTPHHNYFDNAAAARDFGVTVACGEYVVFWDDDNLYAPHYVASMFAAVYGFDIAIARTKHLEHTIGDQIAPGRIDTMCVCVRRDLATNFPWYDGGGGYNDYRWIRRCLEKPNIKIRKIPTIVGRHL